MISFKNDLHDLVARHVAAAQPAKLLDLVEALASGPMSRPAAVTFDVRPRFLKLDASGKETGGAHVAVYDHTTDLVWTAEPLGGGDTFNHGDAMKACANLKLLGSKGWRAPTIQELLSIVDYTRCDPAVDADYFTGPYDWTWSATVAASPSGGAWGVGLGGGSSSRLYQFNHGLVLAVRAGQSLGFGF